MVRVRHIIHYVVRKGLSEEVTGDLRSEWEERISLMKYIGRTFQTEDTVWKSPVEELRSLKKLKGDL